MRERLCAGRAAGTLERRAEHGERIRFRRIVAREISRQEFRMRHRLVAQEAAEIVRGRDYVERHPRLVVVARYADVVDIVERRAVRGSQDDFLGDQRTST